MLRRTPLLLALALIAMACGSTAEPTTTTSTLPTTTTTTTIPAATTTTSSIPATTSTTEAGTTTTTLPGEPVDYGPVEGDVIAVIGVAYDDVLNLRELPGPTQQIIGEIPPTYEDLLALGETRNLPGAFWIKVNYQGTVGWVHMSYIGYIGPTGDSTSFVVNELGEYPTADDMTTLGRIVADVFASPSDPESLVVVVVAESIGDLGEVTYDVVGIGDDAIRGLRLHVFGEAVTDGFSLKSVEVTDLCGRGISPEGLCP